MKKDLDWVIQEIHATRKVLADSESSGNETADEFTFNNGKEEGLVIALKLLDQLDEPEVLSQEWIDENKSLINGRSINPDGTEGDCYDAHYIHVLELQNLLVPKQGITFEQAYDKLREESILSEKSFDFYWNCISDNVEIDEPGNLLVPRQELPVIPNYVAKWISIHHERFDLYPALKRLENNALSWEDVYEWYRRNTHTFVNAYLTREYKVAEEQKYRVVDNTDVHLLCKFEGEVITVAEFIEFSDISDVLKTEQYNLTKEEIKDYDERYWAFAVKVEEMEE